MTVTNSAYTHSCTYYLTSTKKKKNKHLEQIVLKLCRLTLNFKNQTNCTDTHIKPDDKYSKEL